MIEKPSINSFNLLVLNASYSLRLLSLSSVILSSSFTRCKYCSSYRTITTKSIKVVFSKGKLKTANPRPLSAKSTIRPKIEGGGYRFLTREFMKVTGSCQV